MHARRHPVLSGMPGITLHLVAPLPQYWGRGRGWGHTLFVAFSLFCGIFGLIGVASAQTCYPMIMSTYPAGVQRGKTTDVTVNVGTSNGGGNTNLYGAYKAIFEGEGVKAEIVPPEKGWPAKDPKKPNELPGVSTVTMRVTVAADAPLGTREYRVATPRQGISTVGQLVIGDEPEINEVEPNNDPEHAQAVTIPCVVNGKIQQGEDVDNYKFTVAAGQEVTFAVLCARLQDKVHDIAPHADPTLVLRDKDRKSTRLNSSHVEISYA